MLIWILISGRHSEDEEVAGVTDHDKDKDAITGPAGCSSPWWRYSSSAGSLSPSSISSSTRSENISPQRTVLHSSSQCSLSATSLVKEKLPLINVTKVLWCGKYYVRSLRCLLRIKAPIINQPPTLMFLQSWWWWWYLEFSALGIWGIQLYTKLAQFSNVRPINYTIIPH